MLSSLLAGVKCSRTLHSSFIPGRFAISTPSSSRIARTKFQRPHVQSIQTRLSTTSHATATPQRTDNSFSGLLRFKNTYSSWSRWYRSKNDAIAARVRHASRGGSSGGGFRSEPPFKRWFNNQPGEFVVYGILAINGAIYVGWMYAADMFVSCYVYYCLSREFIGYPKRL